MKQIAEKLRSRLASLFFLLLCSSVEASNYVTICKLHDQFGGQLFYTAMVYGMAWENDLVPLISKATFLNALNGETNYNQFFYKLVENRPAVQIQHTPLTHPQHHANRPFQYEQGNICLCNVRTEIWYFDAYREQIRQLFQPTEQIQRKIQNKYPNILAADNTVAVHIRTYDPVKHQNHIFLGVDYYKNAMNRFPNDHKFIIFSDRIDWCKKHLSGHKKNMIFIEGNDHLVDFFLMTMCKNIIAANSTFSWWAAYLRSDTRGRVLVPSIWSLAEYNLHISDVIARDLYLPEWEIIPVTSIPAPDKQLLNYSTTSAN